MEEKKLLFYFYIFPLIIFIIASVILFSINQSFLKGNIEENYFERLKFLGSFFKMEFSKQKSLKELNNIKNTIVKKLYNSKSVIYYAFRINRDTLWHWSSKYEGFLPIFDYIPEKDISIRTLNTPVGKVYELDVTSKVSGEKVIFTVGFIQEYTAILKKVHVRILILFNVLIAVFLFLYYIKIMEYNHSVVEREKIIEKERREKEVFKTLSILSMALSHELRNPLNSLYLIFEKLLIEKNKEKVAELVERGDSEIERIKRFTKSFEMLLKKEAGGNIENTSTLKDRVNLNVLIFSLINELEKSYEINIDLKEDEEALIVDGDRELLSILFYYLIEEFCKSVGRDGFISIKISGERKEVIIKGSAHTRFLKEVDTKDYIPEEERETKIEDTVFLIEKIVDFHNWKIEYSSYELGDLIVVQIQEGGE